MMRDELTQEELNREFYGPKPRVEVRFFDQEVTDVAASKAAGHRVMKSVPYVHLACHREKAEITRPVSQEDKRRYPRAWAAFEQGKEHAEPDAGHRQVQDLRPGRSGAG